MQEKTGASLQPPTSLQGIHAACSELCRRFGFDQFIYISKKEGSLPAKLSIISGTLQQQERSESRGILRVTRSSDAKVDDLESTLAGFPGEFRKEITHFLLESKFERPLRNVVSFPIELDEGHFCILVLSSSMAENEIKIPETQISQARQQALDIHQTVKGLANQDKTADVPSLTQRELDCLQWAAAGKTNWEIGTILGVTERTVRFHLGNIAGKLNTSNRYHTVAQAISLGLVKPD